MRQQVVIAQRWISPRRTYTQILRSLCLFHSRRLIWSEPGVVTQRRVLTGHTDSKVLAVFGRPNLLFLFAGERTMVAQCRELPGQACLKIPAGRALRICKRNGNQQKRDNAS